MEQSVFHQWAPTAPMGWNSWDCFGASVTESEVLANARFMAQHLLNAGYDTVVVDIQWYEPTADSHTYHPFADLTMDARSRLIPAPNRFPSAADGRGFKPLADEIHALGLKFGIHTMRGIPRQAVQQNTPVAGGRHARDIAANNICAWNPDMYGVDMQRPGAQAYYDDVFAQFADWGVDFVKVDDICDSVLYGMHRDEIQAIRSAIDHSGRPMILSLSPGPADLNAGPFLAQNANMWRITDDFWDEWRLLREMFPVAAKWAPYVGDGTWPDCDMLPLGALRQRPTPDHSRFTPAEAQTMLTLWSLMRAPLFLGGDLPQSGPELQWVTNPALLAMRADLTAATETARTETQATWIGTGRQHTYWATFNLSDAPAIVTIPAAGTEAWTLASLVTGQSVTLAPHACLLLTQE